MKATHGTLLSVLLGALVSLAAPPAALGHGDAVPVSELGGAWNPAPAVLAGAAVALALFLQALVRLRRRGRGDHASGSRALLFLAGLAVLTLALVSPLDAAGEEYLLSAHMLQHMAIADVAPALMLVALQGPIVFFLLPRPALRALARVRGLRAALAWLGRPAVGLTLWLLVFAVWHLPLAYGATLDSNALHELEHATFILAGVLVWNLLADPARRGELSTRGRVGAAVALFAAGQVLADVLIFSFEPLYATYAAQDERLLGLSPLTDQRLAGVLMMVEQLVTLGTFAALLLWKQHRRTAGGESARRAFSARA